MKSLSSLIAMGIDVDFPHFSISPKILTYIYLSLAGGIFYTIGDFFVKKWAIGGTLWQYWSGIVIWSCGMFVLSHSFKYDNMVSVSLYIVLVNVICLTLLSMFYFGEPMAKIKIVGLISGIISMWCLGK